MIISPGEKIPLNALLADGDTAKFVRAFLYSNGLPFSTPTVDLTHMAKGDYRDDSVTMPNDIITAIYIAFEDAGYTAPSNFYSGVDVFQPIHLKGDIVQGLDGEIQSNEISAEVETEEVEARTGLQELQASIVAQDLGKSIETNEASSKAGEEDIEGEAGC